MTTELDLRSVVNVADLEALARERMDAAAWDFLAGGAEDEITLGENAAAFARRRFLPRVLVDISTIDTRRTILGREVSLPIGVAPLAAHGLAHPDGEVATARAALAAGAAFTLSTVSSRSIEEVADAVGRAAVEGAPRWFQLYVNEDAGFSRSLVERAAAYGYQAIVLTVDLPVLGYREREKRRGWELNARLGNFETATPAAEPDAAAATTLDEFVNRRHASLTWDDLAEIRSWSSLPLVVKGILHPDDAVRALDLGAAAVWVSNHGGRQLDRAIATLDALEPVVQAVGGAGEVYVDGGIRRGSDALVAIALGATAVFTGRPFVCGLGAGGPAGVERAFAILREELERAMALLGTPTLADVRREHVLP